MDTNYFSTHTTMGTGFKGHYMVPSASMEITTLDPLFGTYRPYPKGWRFGELCLKEDAVILYQFQDGSAIATLLGVDLSESGETEEDAKQNLIAYLENLLGRRAKNPSESLGKGLARRMGILSRMFSHEFANH